LIEYRSVVGNKFLAHGGSFLFWNPAAPLASS
jgi:hypothetical protein